MDTVSEKRLNLVHPVLADKVRQMAATLAAENIFIRVVQGLRTWQEQDDLYAQGRTRPGNKVTNTKGGYSWHCFGCAVDLVPDEIPDDGTFTPDWNVSHANWSRMIEVGKSLGLTSGSEWRTFPDFPHFQLTGDFGANPTNDVRSLVLTKGMQAVWDAVGESTSGTTRPV